MGAPSIVAINLTQRCNLACAHCYLDAGTLEGGDEDELTTREVCGLLDEVAQANTEAMVVLTGGEPLLRKDIEPIVSHGAARGLSIVLGTNGMLLTERRVRSLKEAGLMGVGISIDSLDPARHDGFRGLDGAWEKTVRGLETCLREELTFQIHFSVTRDNAHEVEDIIQFAKERGGRVVNIFFLVCTGRGESMTDITSRQYEDVLRTIIQGQVDYPDLIIRPRCAPHFKRIAYELAPDAQENRMSGREGDGCIAGTQYCRITPTGGVTACPYIPDEVGNIRHQRFMEIWDTSPQFRLLRSPALGGKCGSCGFQLLCGGCRARARAATGDLMAGDPICAYEPSKSEAVIPVKDMLLEDITWADDARQRLNRIPGFVRKLVRNRAEAYVLEQGENRVTCAHLDVLTARRFGGRPPGRRPRDFPTAT